MSKDKTAKRQRKKIISLTMENDRLIMQNQSLEARVKVLQIVDEDVEVEGPISES